MKPSLCLALTLVLVSALAPAGYAAAPKEDITYVIPIKGMIERGLLYAFRRGLREAEANRAGAIILDMDTPGGKLQSAEEMVLLLLDTPIPTYTFVNPRAISAGAIISYATDEIYMTPPGLIGDAMPILMNPLPGGGAQAPSGEIREKIMSPTIALMRSAAQAKGHDEKLGEAMIRPEVEYRIGDRVISPSNQLVTLTSTEAAEAVHEDGRPLLSRGTVKNLDEMLEAIGRADTNIVVVRVSSAERIARVIEGFPMSGILLALGLLGIYIEFKTPGFGIPGLAGLLCLALWFWGHHIAGLAGGLELLVFVAGAMLLLIEIFVIPGFGAAGISGIALMLLSIVMAMIQRVPSDPIGVPLTFPTEMWQDAMLNLGVGLLVAFLSAVLLARVLPQTNVFHRIMLDAAISKEEGYQSAEEQPNLVGTQGVAATPLHPAGIGEFDGERMNVVTRGPFLEKDTAIVIAETHGNRIVVKKLS